MHALFVHKNWTGKGGRRSRWTLRICTRSRFQTSNTRGPTVGLQLSHSDITVDYALPASANSLVIQCQTLLTSKPEILGKCNHRLIWALSNSKTKFKDYNANHWALTVYFVCECIYIFMYLCECACIHIYIYILSVIFPTRQYENSSFKAFF